MCILQLLLNTVTVETVVVISGSKVFYTCVKEVCNLRAQSCLDKPPPILHY